MENLKSGDVVQTSDKVTKTVRSVEGAKVVCDWFVGRKAFQQTFDKDELAVVD